jgi:hypothetical protein
MYQCIIYFIKFIEENKKNGKRNIYGTEFTSFNRIKVILINLWN